MGDGEAIRRCMMRDLRLLDQWRDRQGEIACLGGPADDQSRDGLFLIPSLPSYGGMLRVIASSGFGWDHVSVSRRDRCPHWLEMKVVRNAFFLDHETVMQLHPPLNDYIDGKYPGEVSINTLHLWRPHNKPIPMPPLWMVGARSAEESAALNKIADKAMRKHARESKPCK